MHSSAQDGLIVGAAIGIGLAAKAAERGGADFLLALSAGRYRAMGAASTAAMLPIGSVNALTDEFARREILDQVSIPVYFGAAAMDPRLDLDRFAEELAARGYAGVANFPTVIHLDGRFREAMEEAGLGIAREAALLAAGKKAGLKTLGYAKTRHEAEALLASDLDMLCINFGWNAGGSRGVAVGPDLDEAADRARQIIRHVRLLSRRTITLVEGGPIVSPADMSLVCREAKADGYIGGSTLDRVPLEMSVMQSTSAFKTIGLVAPKGDPDGKDAARLAAFVGLAGESAAFRAVMQSISALAATDLPVLLVGEPGVGKTVVARSLHTLGGRTGPLVTIEADTNSSEMTQRLFGERSLLETTMATVVIEDIDRLSDSLAHRLADWMDGKRFEPIRSSRGRGPARVIATVSGARALHPALDAHFSAGVIVIPPLRDRPTDIAPIVAQFTQGWARAARRPRPDVSPAAFRLLLTHGWPGNVRELKAIIERAAAAAQGAIEPHHLGLEQAATGETLGGDGGERDWILGALRQHRFRRGATAAFLGVSRKTLYNKMRRHGLLG